RPPSERPDLALARHRGRARRLPGGPDRGFEPGQPQALRADDGGYAGTTAILPIAQPAHGCTHPRARPVGGRRGAGGRVLRGHRAVTAVNGINPRTLSRSSSIRRHFSSEGPNQGQFPAAQSPRQKRLNSPPNGTKSNADATYPESVPADAGWRSLCTLLRRSWFVAAD